MAVTLEEHVRKAGDTLGTTILMPLSVAPAAGDVLVVMVQDWSSAAAGDGVSGCGATWTRVHDGSIAGISPKSIVWVGEGATSAGDVTVTRASNVVRGQVDLLLVRGSAATVVAASTGVDGTGGTVVGPAHDAGPGQFVLAGFVQYEGIGTVTWSTMDPTDGWTQQTVIDTGTYAIVSAATRIPTTTVPHTGSMNTTAARDVLFTQVVLGEVAAAPSAVALSSALSASSGLDATAEVRAGLASGLSGAATLAADLVVPAQAGALAVILSGDSGLSAGLTVQGRVSLAAVLSGQSSLAGAPTVIAVSNSSDTFANDGYNYTGTSRVFYEAPIAEPPPAIVREKVKRVHQSLPAPTVVNGRPTW